MEINTAAKAELRTRQFRENPLNLRWWRNTAFGYNEVLGQVGGTVAPLANTVMGFKPVRMLMEKTLGIDHRAPFPTFHFNKYHGWFFEAHPRHVPGTSHGSDTPRPKVAYFHGSRRNTTRWKLGKQIVAVLEHNGFEVLLPEQNCCGLPMQSNGNFAEARRYAQANLRKLAPYAGQGIPIVVGGDCGLELKSDYRELLGIHTAEAKLVAEHVYDINEFLWLQHEQGRLQTDFQPQTSRTIPYHTSCHQKLHRIGRPALRPAGAGARPGRRGDGRRLLRHHRHLRLRAREIRYCAAVGKPLFEKIVASGASVAICDNETCPLEHRSQHRSGRGAHRRGAGGRLWVGMGGMTSRTMSRFVRATCAAILQDTASTENE